MYIYNLSVRVVFVLFFTLAAVSCGGGGGSSGSKDSGGGDGSDDTELVTGQFIDAAVEGLEYQCSTGEFSVNRGTTNSNGEFTCPQGDSVTFYLGHIQLGTVAADGAVVTPYNLYPGDGQSAINLSRILQSIDVDGDVSNGITVNDALVNSIPADADMSSTNFGDYITSTTSITLVTEAQAQAHLNQTIIESIAPTTAPVANAGADQTAFIGNTIILDGSASSDADGDSLQYTWSWYRKPVGSTAEFLSQGGDGNSFVADVSGLYTVSLWVFDGHVTVFDRVNITVNIEPDRGDASLSSLILSSGEFSPEFDQATYVYSAEFANNVSSITITAISSQPGVALLMNGDSIVSGEESASIPLSVGSNTIEIESTALDGMTTRTYVITVTRLANSNQTPVADAGDDQVVTSGVQVNLDGSGSSDSDGDNLTYSWSFVSMPGSSNAVLSSSSGVSPSFLADLGGIYTLQLIVYDGQANSAPDQVAITATSVPVANAGPDQTLQAGSVVYLDGSGSSDSDGDNLTYSWSFLSVPQSSSAVLSDSSSATPNFTTDLSGNYEVQLIVNDGQSDSVADIVIILAEELSSGWMHPLSEDSHISVAGASGILQTAVNNQGQAIAAWTTGDGGTDCGGYECAQVFVSLHDNGSWTQIAGLSDNISPDGFNASDVRVAIDDTGDAIVVWRMNTAWNSLCGSYTSQCSHIYMSEYRDGSWSHPVDMNDHIDPSRVNNVSQRPRVAMADNGEAVIVWQSQSTSDVGNIGIYKKEYRNGSWTQPATTDFIPKSYWNPEVAMDDSGNTLIVWQSSDSNYHSRLYLSEYRGGTWSHPSDLDADAFNPPGQVCPGITCPIPVNIAMDNNGNAIIVWDQRTTTYADYYDGAIYRSEYRNGSWTHPANVNDTVNSGEMTDWARYPEVAMDNNGNALIVWAQNDDTLDCMVSPPNVYGSFEWPCQQIFVSEFRDGSWTEPLNKSDHISLPGQPAHAMRSSTIKSYSVAMSDNGDAVIAWAETLPSDTCGETERQIFVSQYQDGGWVHPVSNEDHILGLNLNTYLPQAMMDDEGTVLLGWTGYVTDLNIYFSQYECMGCETGLPAVIAPRNLEAVPGNGLIDLSWQAVSNADYYNLYWSVSGEASTDSTPITAIMGSSYQHTALDNRTTYSYLVTAVLPDTTESQPSSQAVATPTACAGCEPLLSQTFLSGSISTDEGKGVGVDSDGNVFVTGYTFGGMDGNISNGSSDLFISRYASGSRQWTVQPGSDAYERGNDLALDTGGNIYVAGGGTLLSKYSSSGVLQWSVMTHLFAEVEAFGVVVDASGNIYITGSTTVELYGNPNVGGQDIFLAKYNADGELQWSVQTGTALNDRGNDLALDSEGNILVTGYTSVNGNYIGDAFITKYSPAGDLIWYEDFERGLGDQYMSKAYGIALDADDNAYITGHADYRLFRRYSVSGFEAFVVKYSPDGCFQWARQRGVSGSFDYSNGIVVDQDANIYIIGTTQGALDGNTHNGEDDIFIMKYEAGGIHAWTQQYGEAGHDRGYAIALDASGNILTVGASDGDLNGETNNGSGTLYNFDIFLMKLSRQD